MCEAKGRARLLGEGQSVTITIPSQREYLCLLRAVIGQLGVSIGFDEIDINRITLAVDEACTNVIKYGYEGDTTQEIQVSFRKIPDRLEIRIRDYGKKPDPAKIKPRELEDVRPGGLGTHFMSEIMDRIVYDTSHEVGTELIMTKFVSDAE